MLSTIPIESASFSGHESFPLRFSWLKKGYDQIIGNSSFFGEEDAMVILGTGKNMVRSIRHWGFACRMWDDIPQTRGREVEPTVLGNALLGDDGWDPFLEDLGTIWLLHWLIVTNLEKSTAWSWTFGRPKSNEIRKDELLSELSGLVDELEIGRVSKASLKRDIDVLVRTYCRPSKKRIGEDTLDGPLALLNLVRQGAERGTYEIVQGPHPTLPTGIFEAALSDYISRLRERTNNAISLDDLCYSPLSPGRSFRLTEDALVGHLNTIVRTRSDVYAFDETAGLRQLLVKSDPPTMLEALEQYYAE
jgi:hypothetical protein